MLHLRASEGGNRPSWKLGIAHGAVGAAGFAALAWALATGTRALGAFGWDAIGLLGGALLLGVALPLLRRFRLANGAAMALHGSVAIIGYVILLAYASIR